jgi:hypothetical protein
MPRLTSAGSHVRSLDEAFRLLPSTFRWSFDIDYSAPAIGLSIDAVPWEVAVSVASFLGGFWYALLVTICVSLMDDCETSNSITACRALLVQSGVLRSRLVVMVNVEEYTAGRD